MATIVVTGATGMLGSSLAPLLAAGGHTVLRHGHSGAAELKADLRDYASTAAMLDAAQPDCIVNLAALTNVDTCERDPQAAYLLNVASVEHLARWMQGHPSCHLVQISTDHVYDGPGPHDERHATIRNTYALSKLAGELAAGCVPSTVLRTNFFGRSRCPGRVSFSDWLYGALRAGTATTVFEDVQFSPLAIDTLCAMIARVVQQRPRGVYNLGARNGMSKADFAFALAAALDLPDSALQRTVSTASGALSARRPTDMRMDCSRFEQALGVRLPTLTDEILSLRSVYREPA